MGGFWGGTDCISGIFPSVNAPCSVGHGAHQLGIYMCRYICTHVCRYVLVTTVSKGVNAASVRFCLLCENILACVGASIRPGLPRLSQQGSEIWKCMMLKLQLLANKGRYAVSKVLGRVVKPTPNIHGKNVETSLH